MAGQAGRDFAPNRAIEQIEISDKVQNLVPGKFIREAKFGVHNLLIIHQDEIVKSSSFSQSHAFKHLNIFEKTECPCRCDLFLKFFLTFQDEIERLLPNGKGIVQKIMNGKDLRRLDDQ